MTNTINSSQQEQLQQRIEEFYLFTQLVSNSISNGMFIGEKKDEQVAALDRIADKI